jgi:hypothetical protein
VFGVLAMPEQSPAGAEYHWAMPPHELPKRLFIAQCRIARNKRGIGLAIERRFGAQRKGRPKVEAARQGERQWDARALPRASIIMCPAEAKLSQENQKFVRRRKNL